MVRIAPSTTSRPAFTLIEVVVAMAVLATISAGLLATTWRLTGFARDKAEHMVADAYCHDVMWAIYSQSYTNMLAHSKVKVEWKGGDKMRIVSWDIIEKPGEIIEESKESRKIKEEFIANPELMKTVLTELPWMETVDFFGKKNVTIPLWRTLDTAKVPKCTAQVLETPTNKVITVSVSWWKDGAVEVGHSNVVTRANVERKI